jgi:steroid 5-alpha reductase family enzyme
MTPIQAFAATAATWQNFYMLVGTAAATLIGFMFVAVTFGAGLLTTEATASARAFIDPPFTHLVTVLCTACLMLVPTMNATLLGAALVVVTSLRLFALFGIKRRMREAHERYHDIELSDWLMGVVLPALCYAGLIATGAGFVAGRATAFSGLAVVIVLLLLLGVFGAWELMLWLALTRVRAKDTPTS